MKGMKKRKRVKMKIKPTLVMFIKRIKKNGENEQIYKKNYEQKVCLKPVFYMQI